MSDYVRKKSRLPHWGWWLVCTATLVVASIAVHFGVPAYRRYCLIVAWRQKGGAVYVEPIPAMWLYHWVSPELCECLCSIVAVEASDGFGNADLAAFAAQLADQPTLREMRFGRTDITDVGLVHITGLNAIQVLRLIDWSGRGGITGAGMSHVGKLENLRELSIVNYEINDEGLMPLSRLSNLKELLFEGTHLTEQGIEKLQSALPDCRMRTLSIREE